MEDIVHETAKGSETFTLSSTNKLFYYNIYNSTFYNDYFNNLTITRDRVLKYFLSQY